MTVKNVSSSVKDVKKKKKKKKVTNTSQLAVLVSVKYNFFLLSNWVTPFLELNATQPYRDTEADLRPYQSHSHRVPILTLTLTDTNSKMVKSMGLSLFVYKS